MKSFGGNRPKVERESFELKYETIDEEEKSATFQALSRVSGADIASIMLAMEKGDEGKGVTRLMRLLTKVMDNKDGEVKHGWSPEKLTPPKAAISQRADRPEDQDERPADQFGWPVENVALAPAVEPVPSYRGPDGAIYPFSDTERLASWMDDQAAWTSRRRWAYLMEEDDSAIVDIQDLMKIAEWVISLGTDRPTPARA